MDDWIFSQCTAEDETMLTELFSNSSGGCDIYSYLGRYPDFPDNGRLWKAWEEDGTLRAVCYDDGSYTVWFDADTDSFFPALSVKNSSLFEKPKRRRRLRTMVFKGGPVTDTFGISALSGKELLSVLKLLSGADILPAYLENRYVEIAKGVNNGSAYYAGVYAGERLISAGAITAMNRKFALIGNIFTDKNYRHTGLASGIVGHLCLTAVEAGKIPVLYCENKNVRFYKKLGFAVLR